MIFNVFIKFPIRNQDDAKKVPSSFVLVRMTPKSPCLVLRLAFLGGTSGHLRHEMVKELREKVAKLRFPKRGSDRDKR